MFRRTESRRRRWENKRKTLVGGLLASCRNINGAQGRIFEWKVGTRRKATHSLWNSPPKLSYRWSTRLSILLELLVSANLFNICNNSRRVQKKIMSYSVIVTLLSMVALMVVFHVDGADGKREFKTFYNQLYLLISLFLTTNCSYFPTWYMS